ncbi:OB-fold domain-containing protein [Rhodoferax sp.]|uniref:Zn-ribbon domain-containing OB-fold protein n=1 Tax=Rhodoferax sp. TaxID=50421 RepID=UPI00261108F9|nr:OB-fold domain-containing protein [Rhodoferax sp.]MDD3937639.1 OB-fold domain-containing protein [Rhodoferax sp.]
MAINDLVKQIPVREKLLSAPLTPLSDVRLLGSKCSSCGEVSLGEVSSCQNCAGESLTTIPLSARGTLWTFTVIRNKPPGDFKGQVPMGEGLVELPDGIRVKSPLGGDVERYQIGMELKFVAYPLYVNDNGQEVIAFRFDPV